MNIDDELTPRQKRDKANARKKLRFLERDERRVKRDTDKKINGNFKRESDK